MPARATAASSRSRISSTRTTPSTGSGSTSSPPPVGALAPLFLTAGLLAFTLGGLAALVLARRPGWARPATYGACALGGALTAAAGLAGLGGEAWHWSRPGLLPPPGVELSVDG